MIINGKENLKSLRFRKASNLLTGLSNHCFEQQKGGHLFDTEKNNERNQKLTDRVGEQVLSGSIKNAKMVPISSKHGKSRKTLKPISC